MRRMLIGPVVVMLIAGACASGPRGAQTYTVDMDAPSPEGEKFQVSAYFPGDVRVSAGDTVVFRNRSTEAPHTVTLGVLADRSNQPALFTQDGAESAVAFEPCYSEDDPTPRLQECPHEDLPAYGGTGYWNSGILQPAPAPEQAGPKEVTVELSEDIPAGEYSFVCVLHGLMNGTIQVVEDEGDRSAPEDVDEAREDAAREALSRAEDIEAPELEREEDTVTVSAGWGDRVTAVNRYAPAKVEVPAGTTVRWVARSPYEPHTVTFESPFEQPGDPASIAPGGVKSGSEYTGGFANSGIFGPEGGPVPADQFELTFTTAGEYEYVCTLHPGQAGVVKVTEG